MAKGEEVAREDEEDKKCSGEVEDKGRSWEELTKEGLEE